jgi:hypothetical protein
MNNIHDSLRRRLCEAILPFSLNKVELITYLDNLNRLPLFDILLHFDEVVLLLSQERDSDIFSTAEREEIEEFSKEILSLPGEEDTFWSDSQLDESRWIEIRERARALLMILNCNRELE